MAEQSKTAVKRELLVSLSFMLLAVVAIVKINMGEGGKVADTATLSHATLPTIYGALMLFLAGIVFVSSASKLITGRRGAKPQSVTAVADDAPIQSRAMVLLRTWGTLAILVAYALLLEHVHFILLTTCFLAALFVLYGRRSPWVIALVSLLGGVGFYTLFIYFLNLPI